MNKINDPLESLSFRLSAGYGKARCEPGWNWRTPPLTDYDLWYVASGKGTMQVDGRIYPVAKGCCCLLRPGDEPVADQDPDDRLTVIYVHFEPAGRGGDLHEGMLPISRFTRVEDPIFFESVLNRLLVTCELADGYAAGEVDSLIRLALYDLIRGQEQDDMIGGISARQRKTVAQVCAAVRGSAAGRMTVSDAARLSGLSAEYLSRLFKTITGASLQAFLTRARMERAMLLLTETSMNVSQIADALDYSSVFLFSRQFKTYFGEPPSNFQRPTVAAQPHGQSGPDRPGSGKG